MQNKIKIIQNTSSKQEGKENKQLTNSLKSSMGPKDGKDQFSQMKARVQNVERSYEALKLKCGMIEEERARLEEANKKLLEDLTKQRTLRAKAEKELETLKT